MQVLYTLLAIHSAQTSTFKSICQTVRLASLLPSLKRTSNRECIPFKAPPPKLEPLPVRSI